MNKVLIKKYKAEFDHTLNDKEIIFKFLDDNLGWRSPTILFPINYDKLNILIVKNDEYVEFRKVGSEGKQLQVSYDSGKTWYDKKYTKISWNKKQLVRIKPEEPRFKEGDWVRIVNCDLVKNQKEIFCIDFIDNKNNCFGINSDTEYCNMNYLELWKPEPGEYIWHKDQGLCKVTTNCVTNEIGTAFNCIEISKKGSSEYTTLLEYCEPFIGTLPTFLKDK